MSNENPEAPHLTGLSVDYISERLDRCPKCTVPGAQTIDSRPIDDGRRRRKRCVTCGHRWTTIERIIPDLHPRRKAELDLALERVEAAMKRLRRAYEDSQNV